MNLFKTLGDAFNPNNKSPLLHTGSFSIGIPKDFLVSALKENKYDFYFKVDVIYSCLSNGEGLEISNVSCAFVAVKFIHWFNPGLENYFLDAARNNFENKEGANQDKEIIN